MRKLILAVVGVAALVVLGLLGGLALVWHVFIDGDHAAHFAEHSDR